MPGRRIAFVLASYDYGAIIVNRMDFNPEKGFGVGAQVLELSDYEFSEFQLGTQLLALRRRHHGDGAVIVDCGANIGMHTLRWSRFMRDWGEVIAIEAQERVFYALAGNVALSNCFNVRAIHAAVGRAVGSIKIPQLDHQLPASFGSLDLNQSEREPDVGQDVNYSGNLVRTNMISIDSLNLKRLDMLKIDVEGMEVDVLQGAGDTIDRCKPVILAEWVKSDPESLHAILADLNYEQHRVGMNVMAISRDDPVLAHIKIEEDQLTFQ